MRLILAGVGFIVLASATAGYATTRSEPTVPDVSGKPMAAAVHALVEAGYYADTAPVTSGKVARGKVKRQDPRAGSTLARGKPVRLAISVGEARYGPQLQTVQIPNVVGKTARNARAMLVQKKLTMATKFRTTVSSKDGKVIAQNPTFGLFRQYATVTILVGK